MEMLSNLLVCDADVEFDVVMLSSPQVKMGLLVDLTNTSRFYDRADIEKEGIKYVKLSCKGYMILFFCIWVWWTTASTNSVHNIYNIPCVMYVYR